MRQRGFPLGMLFLLMALCAVLASVLTVLIRAVREGRGDQNVPDLIAAMALVLAVVGGIVGAHHARRLRAGCLGSVVGLLLGALVGPLVVLDGGQAWSILKICLGGSVLLVGVAAVIRWSSRSSDEEESDLAKR